MSVLAARYTMVFTLADGRQLDLKLKEGEQTVGTDPNCALPLPVALNYIIRISCHDRLVFLEELGNSRDIFLLPPDLEPSHAYLGKKLKTHTRYSLLPNQYFFLGRHGMVTGVLRASD